MTHSLRHKWDELCAKFWTRVILWFDRREKLARMNRGVCPVCEDKRRGFICPVCRGVKIRPFTKDGRKIIRDRYLNITGVDLFGKKESKS